MPSPRGIIQRFDEHLHRSGLLAPKSRLLVAVSGGADSVALLRLLIAVNGGKHWQFSIICGHVNHNTRGKESDGDEKFVKKLAAELGVKFLSRKLPPGKKSEAALRDGRFAALAAMKQMARCKVVVLAHHAGDQAETVLMRILRGTGITGLAGIAGESDVGSRIVRPMLVFSPEELREYLNEIGQPWREDSSNESIDYLRNRIRHEVMPLLEKLQPGTRAALTRLADRANEASEVLEARASEAAKNAGLKMSERSATMNRESLRDEHRTVIATLFRNVIEKINGGLSDLSAERMDAAVRIAIATAGGKTVQLGGGVTMKVEGKRVIFERGEFLFLKQK